MDSDRSHYNPTLLSAYSGHREPPLQVADDVQKTIPLFTALKTPDFHQWSRPVNGAISSYGDIVGVDGVICRAVLPILEWVERN